MAEENNLQRLEMVVEKGSMKRRSRKQRRRKQRSREQRGRWKQIKRSRKHMRSR